MPKVVHVITDFSTGGAQMMLYKLVSKSDRTRCEHAVISLTTAGDFKERFSQAGYTIHCCNMAKTPIALIRGLWRLFSFLRQLKPDVVQTWMYTADLMAGTLARILGIKNVVWNIRQSTIDWDKNILSTFIGARVSALLSSVLPKVIVSNAYASKETHMAIGYSGKRFKIIPNGFDTGFFTPNLDHKKSIRNVLSIPEDTKIVGMIARFDPQKNYKLFIQAMERVAQRFPNVCFIAAGNGINWQNEELISYIKDTSLQKHFKFLGRRKDNHRIVASFDIGVLSSSWGEGFPNAVGEIMSSGVPCVITDVGDGARLVGDTGIVIPKDDPEALAEGVLRLLKMPEDERILLGQKARARILEHYSIDDICRQYEDLYLGLLGFLENEGG